MAHEQTVGRSVRGATEPGPFSRRSLLRGAGALGLTGSLLGKGPLRSAGAQEAAVPARPFPQRVPFASNAIRPSTRSQAEQDADVRAAYDRWKASYLVREGSDADGHPLVRVAFGRPETPEYDVTVSEGQGFGMVILPHVAGHDPEAQLLFDGLWRFTSANPSAIDDRLMSWRVPPFAGIDSAFDGDADMAYGLLLADAQWGSTGDIDYAAAADVLLIAIMESTIGPESRLPMLGDWVDPKGELHNQWTPRTSDFMLGHFRAFGRASGDGAWDDVVMACQEVAGVLQATYSPETGLLPDFVQPVSADDRSPRPADPDFLESATDGAFGYNAGRVPWRFGVDALLNGDDVTIALLRRMSTWIEGATGGDPAEIKAGYWLDGTPLPGSDYFTSFFAAPFAVAAMTNPDQQAWLDELYEAVRVSTEEYYEDSVALLCLLALTGTFWDPTQPATSSF